MTTKKRALIILLVVLCVLLGIEIQKARGDECKSDSDCSSGKECKESVSGKMRCYPKEKQADPGYKKCKWVTSKEKCGEHLCWPMPVTFCANTCCVPE